MKRRLASVCAPLVALACFSQSASAVTLYNPSLGSTPAAQGWLSSTSGGSVASSVSGGAYRVDTTASAAIQSGSALSTAFLPVPQALDTVGGFDLRFGLQVVGESHLSDDRAGYAVTVIGADPTRSIELGFWQDRVWAYAYDPATKTFSHGAEAFYDTASAASAYALTVQNQRYTLTVGGTALLSGALVDYSSSTQSALYATPNAIFFGDDTTRAGASTALGSVVLAAVPEPASAGLFLLGGALVAMWRRRPRR